VGSARSVVLVVGAAGKFAGLVVPALRRRDVAVRALVRDEARAAVARSLGATEIAIGDLRDAASLAEATRGVDGVFHIGPAFAADEAAMGVALVEAAQRSGVRKFVFSSVIQPTNIRLANHASKVAVEDALYSSRLEYTILHPANFMQNIGLAWASIRDDGCFAEPFPNDTRIARVDYRDVAETAAIALTQDRLAFATLELCAGMYSRLDVVAALSEALGVAGRGAAAGFRRMGGACAPALWRGAVAAAGQGDGALPGLWAGRQQSCAARGAGPRAALAARIRPGPGGRAKRRAAVARHRGARVPARFAGAAGRVQAGQASMAASMIVLSLSAPAPSRAWMESPSSTVV